MLSRARNSSLFKVTITLVAQLWGVIISIILLPVYVNLIGVESYGLVAFFTTLTGALAILDLGLSSAISRQFTILRTREDSTGEQRTLLFSVEVLYWVIGVLIGAVLVASAGFISEHWVNSRQLEHHVIHKSVALMGVIFAFQWPSSVYIGCLNGVQRQERVAFVNILYASARAIAMVLVLYYVSTSIIVFFIVQLALTVGSTLLFRYAAWSILPLGNHRLRFSRSQLGMMKKFATGMAGISLITFFLSQIDKLIVSKYLLLENVGFYNLAFTLANMLPQLIAPLQSIFFPKFSSMMAAGQTVELTDVFRRSAKWVSIVVIPVAILLFLFSHEILFLWTHNAVVSDNTAPILRFAALGTMFNCLMWVPYYYMLAAGNTKFSIVQNVIACLIFTPLLFWSTAHHGAVGTSMVWFGLNIGYIMISIPVFHHMFFKSAPWKWYKDNLLLPLLLILPPALLLKYVLTTWNIPVNYLTIIVGIGLVVAIYSLLTYEVRNFLRIQYLRFYPGRQ